MRFGSVRFDLRVRFGSVRFGFAVGLCGSVLPVLFGSAVRFGFARDGSVCAVRFGSAVTMYFVDHRLHERDGNLGVTEQLCFVGSINAI